jgi:DNA-directed RNA polymerase subunit RPC12/RpoP
MNFYLKPPVLGCAAEKKKPMGELTVSTFRKKPSYEGYVLRCPKCGRKLLEAEIMSLLTRCRKCGRWILVKKAVDK